MREDKRQYVPLRHREETFEEKLLKDDAVRTIIRGPKKYWEEDPEEFIRKLKLDMEANPNAFRIKTSKRKPKRKSKKTSKRRK